MCVCVLHNIYIGEGNGNPLLYSYLGSPMDRGDWWAAVHGSISVRHDLATIPLPPTHTHTHISLHVKKKGESR